MPITYQLNDKGEFVECLCSDQKAKALTDDQIRIVRRVRRENGAASAARYIQEIRSISLKDARSIVRLLTRTCTRMAEEKEK